MRQTIAYRHRCEGCGEIFTCYPCPHHQVAKHGQRIDLMVRKCEKCKAKPVEEIVLPAAIPDTYVFTLKTTRVNYRREKVGIIDRRGRYVQRTSAMGEANRNERKRK